jgi:hypothetical protein
MRSNSCSPSSSFIGRDLQIGAVDTLCAAPPLQSAGVPDEDTALSDADSLAHAAAVSAGPSEHGMRVQFATVQRLAVGAAQLSGRVVWCRGRLLSLDISPAVADPDRAGELADLMVLAVKNAAATLVDRRQQHTGVVLGALNREMKARPR